MGKLIWATLYNISSCQFSLTQSIQNAEKVKEESKPKLAISDTTLNENDDAYEIADKITNRLLRKYLRNEMKLVKHEFDINTTL